MKNTSITWFFRVGLCIASIPIADARTWTDKTGNHKVEADFVSLADGKVTLKGANGAEKVIPLATLSAADQAFAKKAQAKATGTGDGDGGTGAIKTTAKASLSKWTMTDEKGKETSGHNLAVEIDLTGGTASGAFAVGPMKADPITVGGKEFKFEEHFGPSGFKTIDRSKEEFFSGHPKNGVRVDLNFGEVPEGTKKIALVKGSVKVLAGGTAKEVVLKDLLERANGDIKDPALTAAGLKFKFKRDSFDENVSVNVEMKVGTTGFVGLKLIGADGKAIGANSGSMSDGRNQAYSLSAPKDQMAGATLKILFRDGAKEIELPFEVKDVKVTGH